MRRTKSVVVSCFVFMLAFGTLLPIGCTVDGGADGDNNGRGGSAGKGSGGANSGASANGGSGGKGGSTSSGGSDSSGGTESGSTGGGSGSSDTGGTSNGDTGGTSNGDTGGTSSSGGSTSSGGTSSSGGSSGTSSTGGTGGSTATGCGKAGLVWKTGRKTNYTSYPEPGSEECIKYSGCEYQGQFAACSGVKSEKWVSEHNFAAVFPLGNLSLHDLCLKSNDGKTIVVTVYDTCGDGDCGGCCTENKGSADALIDLESYTNDRWGVPDGTIQWADLGKTTGSGCN